MVFAFHTGFLRIGWMGVHLFFVLSGFLITGVLRRTRTGPAFWAPFYIKRAARILPPLLLIFLAAATIYLQRIQWRSVGLLDIFFLGDVAQTLYPRQDANLGVLWSLAVEEHFYLLWPFAIRFLDRRRMMQLLLAILLVEPILRALVTPFTSSHGPIYYLTPFQFDGLAAGSLLALLVEDPGNLPPLKKWGPIAALLTITLLLALSLFRFFQMETNTILFNSLGYSLVVLASAGILIIVLLRPDAWLVRQLAHPAVVLIGAVSYGMYLYNPIVLDFVIAIGHAHGIRHDKLIVPLAIALTILLSWLSFRFYETPIMQRGRRLAHRFERGNHPVPPSPIAKPPVTPFLCVLALVLVGSHAAAQSKETLYQGDHPAMGTTYTVFLYAPDAITAHTALEAAFDEIDRVDDLLSNYKPTSEISRINREAPLHPVITDAETFAFLQSAMAYSRNTNGAFDITVGRLLHTWGFFQHQGAVPSAAAQHADAAGVGWQHVHLDPATRSVQFLHSSRLELDPGGIGKGYAVDRVVALLRDLHITRALISAGSSSLYMIGSPPGAAGWPVQIPDPTHTGATLQTLRLHDVSLSTSACSEKHFVQDGHDYCHIFDPRTLVPVEGMLQTTIISPLAIDSDALSTGLFVTTPAQSRIILQQYPGIAALILSGDKTGPVITSIRWPQAVPLRK